MSHLRGIVLLALALLLLPAVALAGMPPKVERALRDSFPPAEWHHGLETAAEQIDPGKLRGYVVVLRGGIPAERARFFITWEDYDYRGVTIHADKGDEITTRRGAPYTYLQPGTVMAVADLSDFNTTAYLKLISPEVYVPDERALEKHHSRVTVMLGVKLPKDLLKADDEQAVLAKLDEWLKPFKSLDEAKAFATQLREGMGAEAAPAATPEAEKAPPAGKAAKKGKAAKDVAPSDAAGNPPVGAAASAMEKQDSERIQTLEQRIEKTRQDLEQAEKDLNEAKKAKE